MTASVFFDALRIGRLIWNVLRSFLPYLALRLLGRERDPAAFGRRLRVLIERMGVTYVKLGQYLAIRYDLFSPETCGELSKLMGDVPALPFEHVRGRVENALGGPLEAFYLAFEAEALAAASIAQVHRAVAGDGMPLAVKIQRPGVEESFRADLRNLRRLASSATKLGLTGGMSVVEVVEELGKFTLREFDFLQEAATADRIRRESPSYVRIPRIRWDLTTPIVLSMEFIEGVSLLTVCQLAESGHENAFQALIPMVEPRDIAVRLARACLTQEYVTGRFHGDPHPANILIDTEGRIAFVDFGIFGELSLAQRRLLAQYAMNLATGRFSQAFRHYEELVSYGAETDVKAFRADTIGVLRSWHTASSDSRVGIAEKLGARYQIEMLGVMRRHRVRMQPDQVLFWRCQAVLDATAHRLPVDFDMLGTVADFLKSPEVAEALGYNGFDEDSFNKAITGSARLVRDAPRSLRDIARAASAGSLRVGAGRSPSDRDEREQNKLVKLLVFGTSGVGIASAVHGFSISAPEKWALVAMFSTAAFLVGTLTAGRNRRS